MKERLAALKAFVSPTKYLLLKGTPPTVEQRLDYLLKNPNIPTDGDGSEQFRNAILENLDDANKNVLINKIDLLNNLRVAKNSLKNHSPIDIMNYLRNNPSIPTDDSNKNLIIELMGAGLKTHEKK